MKANAMAVLMAVLAVASLHNRRTQALPAASFRDAWAMDEEDSNTVASLKREVRTVAVAGELPDLLLKAEATEHEKPQKHPKNASGKSNEGGFYKTFGSDAEGEKGYLKKSFSKGDHGYKTLDTFHKKLGDRYGFEEHEAFGAESAADKNDHKAKSAKAHSHHKQTNDPEGAGTIVATQYADEGDYSGYAADDGGDFYAGGGGGSAESGYAGGGGSGGSGEGYSEAGDGSGEAYAFEAESSAEEADDSFF